MYTLKRGNTYYFNRRIQGKILCLSLRTKDRELAKERAVILFLFTNRCLRKSMKFEEIKRLAMVKAKEWHEEWVLDHLGEQTGRASESSEVGDEEFKTEAKEALLNGNLSESEMITYMAHGMYVELKNRTYEEWRRPVIPTTTELQDKIDSLANLPTSDEPKPIRISEKLEEFINHKSEESAKGIKESTLNTYRVNVNLLIEYFGDIYAKELKHHNILEFRSALLKTPKNRNSAANRDKTLKELIEQNSSEELCLKRTTIDDKLGYLSAYFDYLKRIEEVKLNPFDGVRFNAEKESWSKYTVDDLNRIFGSPLFGLSEFNSNREKATRSNWWLILIAVYTGARIGEIVQLELSDIKEIDDILCFSLLDEEKQIKSEAGRRVFPVHSVLLRAGLKDYCEQTRNKGHKRLLPSIKQGKDKPGSEASKWYNERYRQRYLEGFKEQRKVFHSFRHTFIEELLPKPSAREMVQQIVGHEPTLLGATRTYFTGYKMDALKEAIEQLQYKDIQIDHLFEGGWRDIPDA